MAKEPDPLRSRRQTRNTNRIYLTLCVVIALANLAYIFLH